jgi:hypothetical protein
MLTIIIHMYFGSIFSLMPPNKMLVLVKFVIYINLMRIIFFASLSPQILNCY